MSVAREDHVLSWLQDGYTIEFIVTHCGWPRTNVLALAKRAAAHHHERTHPPDHPDRQGRTVMTKIKLNGAMPAGSIPDHVAGAMWDALGTHYMGIVELRVAQRTEPANGDPEDPSAQLRVTHLELAQGSEDDDVLREALKARYQARTSADTLDGVLDYPGRTDTGQLRDPLAVLHTKLLEDKELRGFPVDVDWEFEGTESVLVIRMHQKPDEADAA